MRFWIRKLALVLLAGTLIVMGGCRQQPAPTTESTSIPTESLLSAREQYSLACEYVDQAPNWILDYTVEEKRLVGQDTYIERVDGKASFSKLWQQDMVAVVEEQCDFGGYGNTYTEIYCAGTAYAQVNSSNFSMVMTPERFVSRQLPAVLLDSDLYRTVTRTVTEDATVISFTEASGLESWLGDMDARLVSASGTATLDSTGALWETTYQAEYVLGETTYTYSATVRVTAPQTLDLGATHQEHIQNSVRLENIDVPKMLLQAVGAVYASEQIDCDAVETIFSEAIPVTYSQRSRFCLSGAGETLDARAEYSISLSDYRGEASAESWTETFKDGVFNTTQDNGNDTAMTAEQIRRYYEDAILSALAAPIYLGNASLQDNGDHYRLEISGNDDFVADLMTSISQFLQVDLDAKAQDSKTLSASGYLTIDKETGLPTAMGLNMERQHTIDGIAYALTYSLDQTMALSDTE